MPNQDQSTTESSQIQSSDYDYAKDRNIRRLIAKDFRGFCATYLAKHFTIDPASFHEDLMHLLSDHNEKMLEIIGFRGSAKSTFGSLALVLWCALEHPDKYQYIITCSDTSAQSKQNMANIKSELDNNWLLRNDYGSVKPSAFADENPEPDLESDEDWQAQNVLLENGVRIISRSRGQKVRGLKHRESRPKLIVVDDPEDRDWTKKKENRDKTNQWMRGEVIPARDPQSGRIVVIGNWLHEDALMARLKKTGMFKVKEFALIENGICTWPAQYPTDAALEKERQIAGETIWRREYLLQIVAEEGAIITERDISFYDGDPTGTLEMIGHGVDLAISKDSSADYTVDVIGEVRYHEKENRSYIYIRPHPMNERLSFLETIQHCIAESKKGNEQQFYVEKVQYQQAAIETLINAGVNVVPVTPSKDKRARLIVASSHIKNGTVRFPRIGCEDLLAQLYGFGTEAHDDLCLIGETLVLTNKGQIPIKDIRAGDMVMTRKGYKKVLWSGKTGKKKVITKIGITGTPDHPVITTNAIKGMQYLNPSDIVYIWNNLSLTIEVKTIDEIQTLCDDVIRYITGVTTNGNLHRNHCIGKFILITLEKFLKACVSITKMAIHSIISQRILNSKDQGNIYENIYSNPKDENNQEKISLNMPSKQQKNGTDHQREENGIVNTQKDYGLKSVYNLTIKNEHEFFANGILVHNCDGLVYLINQLSLFNLNFVPIDAVDMNSRLGHPQLPTDPLNKDYDII